MNQKDDEEFEIRHVTDPGYKHIPAGGLIGDVLVNVGNGIVNWMRQSDLNTTGGGGAPGTAPKNAKITIDPQGAIAFNDGANDKSFTLDQADDLTLSLKHLTTSGYRHIPSGGASGDILSWESSGKAMWKASNENSLVAKFSGASFSQGEILSVKRIISTTDIDDVIVEAEPSQGQKDSGILGVFVKDKSTTECILRRAGVGLVKVCNSGGDIEEGDLICSSASFDGVGEKQDDDINHSYTVAKSLERAVFTDANDVKMVACLYIVD
jgi:hypothetical protein